MMRVKVSEENLEEARDMAPAVMAWYSREASETAGMPFGDAFLTVNRGSSVRRQRQRFAMNRQGRYVRKPKMATARLMVSFEVRACALSEEYGIRAAATVWTKANWTPADLETAIARTVASAREYARRCGVLSEGIRVARERGLSLDAVAGGERTPRSIIEEDGACEEFASRAAAMEPGPAPAKRRTRKKTEGSKPAARGSGRKPR